MARPRKTVAKRHQTIVNARHPPESKAEFDKICDERGMTIKAALCRLTAWFARLDKTEQAIVLGQVDEADFASLADQLVKRGR